MDSDSGGRAGALKTARYGAKRQEELPRPALEDVWAGLGLVIVVAVVLGTLFLVGSGGRESPTDATPEQIAAAPLGLIGQGVTVTGSVDELLTDQALTVSNAGETVLVLVPPDAVLNGLSPVGLVGTAGRVIAPGDHVDVAGTIWSFDRVSLSEEHGLILHERLFAPWQGTFVVVADEVQAGTAEDEAGEQPADGPVIE
jgi:hypothetical protein